MLPWKRQNLDPDARAFCARSGATERREWSDFLRGVKGLGLYEKLVCWSGRAAQNAGTGSTVYSAGGLGRYDGTMVNGPTWGENGVKMVASPTIAAITIPIAINAAAFSLFVVFFRPATGTLFFYPVAWDANNTGPFWSAQNDSNSGFLSSTILQTGAVGTSVPGTNSVTSSNIGAAFCSANTSAQNCYGWTNTASANNMGSASLVGGAASFISSATLRIGGRNVSSGNGDGTVAFVAYFTEDIRQSVTALFALYKGTLGKGLGLP